MLSWSGNDIETEIDLSVVATGHGAMDLPLGNELLGFASAAADLAGDAAEVELARKALVAVADEAVMVDAAAVAANFHMMTRLADGTGARYPTEHLRASADAIHHMGAEDFASRR